jgi:asparagine synthetase B (glutamine-hydrolysing)
MDVRGNQASGFAYQSSTTSGVYKKNVAGANLSVKQMSKGTRLAVLHTRYATHGSAKVMENNHPVLSPDKSISLVHNGVIYNHDIVRKGIDANLPEVDTAVIPALLQQFDRDTDSFERLDGDASVAWLDEQDRLTLKVARVSHSPLVIAQLKDGSFVFASTEQILLKALDAIKLSLVYMENVPERVLMTVRDGVLTDVDALPAMNPAYEDKFMYDYKSYRGMTSGGYQFNAPVASEIDQNTSMFASNGYWLEDESEFDLPEIDGYTLNEFGEYFDESGVYMGSIDDMIEMGYIYETEIGYKVAQNFQTGFDRLAKKYVDELF